jgi:hypothetical protein
MGAEEQVPHELLEQLAAFRLPEQTDRRLQDLMDRNNDGLLVQSERDEFESLIAVSDVISLLRAKALRILGRKP